MARLQLRRGLYTNLPTSGMLAGEPHVTTDRGTLHVATDATTKLPVVPAIDALSTLAAIDGAADLLIMHDASATGQKEKKITFDAFKTALNIPAGSSDEKVAVVAVSCGKGFGIVKTIEKTWFDIVTKLPKHIETNDKESVGFFVGGGFNGVKRQHYFSSISRKLLVQSLHQPVCRLPHISDLFIFDLSALALNSLPNFAKSCHRHCNATFPVRKHAVGTAGMEPGP